MKIVFMGTPGAAVPTLERIIRDGHEVPAVYTQPDRPAGRGNKITHSPVKKYAAERGLHIVQPAKIKTPEALQEFKSFQANAAVVVAYGRILPESFLTSFPMGAINVHFSLLPKFRGAAPVNWAIVNGETETGVTTMQMDAGLDSGPILLQRSTEIAPDETSIELMERLSRLGAELLSETLLRYSEITPRKQDEIEASTAPILKKEDGLISWMLSAREIGDRVRGFQPFPGAFTYYGDKRTSIWKAKVLSQPLEKVVRPGEIIRAHGDELWIACGGASALCIEELQPEGKRRMPARDFINGVRPTAGDSFGGTALSTNV